MHSVFTVALFTRAQDNLNVHQQRTIQINMWYIYTVKCYLAIKDKTGAFVDVGGPRDSHTGCEVGKRNTYTLLYGMSFASCLTITCISEAHHEACTLRLYYEEA